MNRLTKNIPTEETINGYTDDVIAALRKLKTYEDLEERCIDETTWSLRMLLEKWNIFFEDIVDLINYRRKEDKGLLKELCCKVGDTIYFVSDNATKPIEMKVDRININNTGMYYHADNDDYEDILFTQKDVGVDIFMDKDEAESKHLKK